MTSNEDLKGLAARENFRIKKSTNRSKYHQGSVDAIVDALASGLTIVAACGIVGISQQTYYNWLDKYPEFREAVDGARPVFESEMQRVIKEQAPKDWRAAAWLLERRYPESYSLKREVDVSIKKSDGTDQVIEFLKQAREGNS
jgi:transposase-like protein